MGHVRNYAIGDAMARFHLMSGYNVLHPMGWDAFGLPAENAAIERNIHPSHWTYKNIDAMRDQFKRLGYSFDWDREVATCHPQYYRWCQWFFLKMVEKNLAYRKKSSVNWCESCRTILANEQVEGGTCWRCHHKVDIREVDGWFLKITDYAEELLNDHAMLEGNWPERVLTMQKNWIGRSEGAWIDFPLADGSQVIKVFTTRPDTLFGATFMVLAPENPLAIQIAHPMERVNELNAFADKVRNVDIIERTASGIPKEGLFTGAYAINPLTEEQIPIWVSDFVLMEYGTGAIMSVPAHDQRDFEFARKYHLPIRIVIAPEGQDLDPEHMTQAFAAVGTMVNSGPFNGMNSDETIQKITDYCESKGFGKKAVTYRLRDWGISRQRYWGTPIPIIYCDTCGIVPVPEKDLPVVLPMNAEFDWSLGGNPLARCHEFVHTTCPKCNKPARRETDTMDTFIDSSWYFARYTSARDTKQAVNPDSAAYWMPVDQYVGGIEHAVMHLLYARFFHKFMRDLGLVKTDEPFTNLLTQGMVCLEVLSCPTHGYLYPEEAVDMGDGSWRCSRCDAPVVTGRSEKMSKSKRNTKDPEAYLSRYGADTIRLFSLFAAPPEKDCDWSDSGVEGIFRFLKRVWRLAYQWQEFLGQSSTRDITFPESVPFPVDKIRHITHSTIRRVTADFKGRFHFNTSISACMELVNTLNEIVLPASGTPERPVVESALIESFRALTLLLNPFAPHLAEELWEMMGHSTPLVHGPWPTFDDAIAAEKSIEIVLQVNGKIRTRMIVAAGTPTEELEQLALQEMTRQGWISGKTVRKVIAVPDRLVNLVVT